MRSLRGRGRTPALRDRLQALREVVELAEGRFGPEPVSAARAVTQRAVRRLELDPDMTVVALAGATGSGKSSIFNALAGSDLSEVGVRRPTTATSHACVWGEDPADELLDWLQVPRRYRHPAEVPELDRTVLLDLPDHDSTSLDHRLEVDRLVDLVDLLVWVVDPQKYADAALHERYLRRLSRHRDVVLVVLNHVDRLDESTRAACVKDLETLLGVDGLAGVPVVAASARTGEGLPELRSELAQRVATRRAALERLTADVAVAAAAFSDACGGRAKPKPLGKPETAALIAGLSDAGGVATVTAAVYRSHLQRAVLATGWPFTRWIHRMRPDPLARLHLRQAGGEEKTSLPPPTPVQRAQLGSALRAVADAAAGDLPPPWPAQLRRAASAREEKLPELLDRTVSAAEVDAWRSPRWWSLAGVVQKLLALVAIVGAVWLIGLFVVAWLQLPDPPTPRVEDIPLPTLLFLGGLVGGVLVALVCRGFARAGAARRRNHARRKLEERIAGLAESEVLRPVREELEVYERFCGAVGAATG